MIYVVTFTGYEDDDFPVDVVGAYSSQEEAERAIRKKCQPYWNPDHYARKHYDVTAVDLDGDLTQ